MTCWDIIHPRGRFSCITPAIWIQSRWPLDSIDVLTRPCPLTDWLSRCKYTKKFLIANDFCKKLAENVASSTKKARFLLLSQEIKVCLKSL